MSINVNLRRTYTLRPLRHRSPCFTDKLLSIEPDLNPVVEEGEEGGEREGGHEDRDEPELENHLKVLLEQALVADKAIVGLSLGLCLSSLLQLLLVPPGLDLGDDDLLRVVDALLPHHDHPQLLGKLDQTTTWTVSCKLQRYSFAHLPHTPHS